MNTIKIEDGDVADIISAGGIPYYYEGDTVYVFLALHREYGYVIPKGRLRPEETPLEAAQREIKEETGIIVSGLPYISLSSLSYLVSEQKKKVHLYGFCLERSPAPESQELSLDKDEKIEVGNWLRIDDAIQIAAHDTERNALAELKSKLDEQHEDN
ncbi:MAG: NUDIX domain-containing protein [Caldisericaceae bacterium]